MSRLNKARGLLAAATLLAGLTAISQPAFAQASEQARAIDIAAGSLGNAIAQLGRKNGVVIAFDPALVRGRRSNGLRGAYSIQAALNRLLAGPGLQARPDGTGGYLVVRAPSQPPLARATQPVVRTARREETREQQSAAVDEILVTALRQTTTVAKQGVEVRELPQAITIVPKQVLDEAAARRVEDVYYQTVGITAGLPFAGAVGGGGSSRGFGANQLVDGHAQGFAGIATGLAIVDRVEILRGPTSVLYGQGDPGGSINLVLKKAGPAFGASASVTADTVGTRLADFDIGGSIAGDTLSARLVGQGEYSTTFRDFEKNRRFSISPIVHVEPWEGMTIDALGSFDRYKFSAIRDYLVFDPVNYFSIADLKRIPLSRNYSEPTLPLSQYDVWLFNISAEQRLGEHWTIGGSFYSYLSQNKGYYELVTDVCIPGTTLRDRYYGRSGIAGQGLDDYNQARTYSAYLKGNFSLAGTEHKLVVTAESLYNTLHYDAGQGGIYIPIDTKNPVYQSSFVEPANLDSYPAGSQYASTKAVYANDLISIGTALNIQLGLRYDWIKTVQSFSIPPAVYHDRKLSPSAGVVWHPSESTSLYASYSTSFVPVAGITRFNTPLKPERSKSYEIGIKQEFFDRRLAVTLAVFDTTKSDIVQSDLTDPFRSFVINGGTARSQGFEFEFEGRPPVPGMSVRGGLAYANARITESTDYTPGDKLVGSRPWTGLFSVRQELEPLGGPDAWVSANLSYGGSQEAAIPSSGEKIPAFTRIDLAAGTRFGPVEVQLNLKNLANRRIIFGNGGGRAAFDNPRSFGVTLRYRTGAMR